MMKLSKYSQIILACSLWSFASVDSWAESTTKTIASSFVPEQYKSVSHEEIMRSPQKYAGVNICIDGYLGRDFDWADTQIVPALYNKRISPSGSSNALKISIDPYYANALDKFGLFQKCVIFGICFIDRSDSNKGTLITFLRIDHVESKNGSEIDIKFNLTTKN